MRELKGKRAANYDIIGTIFLDELREAEGDTVGDIGVSIFASNRGSLAAIMSTDGGARGDVFPF